MKINSLQEGVLLRLRDGAKSAYGLGAGLGTLNALGLKGLVKADRSKSGCFSMPRTSIVWHITDAGKRQVAYLDKDGLPVSNGPRETGA